MPIPFIRYSLTNLEGGVHQVTRYDRQENGTTVHVWALKDGRKLDPTTDGYLKHTAGNLIFVTPTVTGNASARELIPSPPHTRPKIMPIPQKRYTLTNTDGASHQVTRYDRKVGGEIMHAWALKDGRKLEPTADGYLEQKTSKMLFVMPNS